MYYFWNFFVNLKLFPNEVLKKKCVELINSEEFKRGFWLVCKPLATRESRERQVQGQQRIDPIVPACHMEEVAKFVLTVCNSAIFKLGLI